MNILTGIDNRCEKENSPLERWGKKNKYTYITHVIEAKLIVHLLALNLLIIFYKTLEGLALSKLYTTQNF